MSNVRNFDFRKKLLRIPLGFHIGVFCHVFGFLSYPHKGSPRPTTGYNFICVLKLEGLYEMWKNTIHLFPLHKGDMKICFPEKSHDYFEGEKIFISPLCKGNECFIPPGQRFGEFRQMESFGHLCLQNYYFGTSLELIPLYDQSVKSWEFRIREIRYCWEGNTMLLRGKYHVLINVTWDCFYQSNFYTSRINIIEWNNMFCQ